MTVQTISQSPGTSLADLQEVQAGMQEYIRAATAESRQTALDAANKRGLFQRMFPTQFEKERQRIGVQSMRQLGESRQELLAILTHTQIEIARKSADALIAAQGMHLQEQLAIFATAKIAGLNDTMNAARTKFMRDMRPQFELIEEFKDRPELYEPAYQSVVLQIGVYFDFSGKLLNGFIESLNNRVGSAER